MTRRATLLAALLLALAPAIALAQTPAKAYTPPRTPWGDPDLQGVWPGTEMVGVPVQRPREFGTRNVLTDDEFHARVQQAEKQQEIDTMDFDLATADTSNAGEVGSATSPPP